ncbi:Retrovirus-related Pol polyprotein from transposon TNT 1-94 [Linum perenne]
MNSTVQDTNSSFAVTNTNHRPRFHAGSSSSGSSRELKCRHCSEFGHSVSHCRKRNFCNYCKTPGHIILECPILKSKPSKLASSAGSSSAQPSSGVSYSVHPPLSPAPATSTPSSSIAQLVQEELQRVLPAALQSAFAAMGLSGIPPTWFLDSACFNHMTGDKSVFSEYKSVDNVSIEVASGQKLLAAGVGTAHACDLVLPNTLHVPKLVPNLVSVGQLTDNGYKVSFDPSGCVIQDPIQQRLIGHGMRHDRNFILRRGTPIEHGGHCSSNLVASTSLPHNSAKLWDLWHNRLGHPHSLRLLSMFQKHLLPHNISMKNFSVPACEHCISAKHSKSSFHSSTTEITTPFALIHTDLWGPAPVTSRLGFRYFVLFVDHATRFTWVFFLRFKSDLLTIAKDFIQLIRTQFGTTIQTIRSDPGGEFSSKSLREHYAANGISYQQSCPGVSEQNGLVERKNRHVLELGRALLLQSRVPASFWPEVIHTMVHLINRQTTPVLHELTPYEKLFHRPPKFQQLRGFGCVCFVLLPAIERTKFMSKSAKCVFMGYSDHHKGYFCYDPQARRMRIAHHVIFLEHLFYYDTQETAPSSTLSSVPYLPNFDTSGSVNDNEDLVEEGPPAHVVNSPAHHPPPTLDPAPLRRSTRATLGQLPSRFNDYVAYSAEPVSTPLTYKQACMDSHWLTAMQEEINALEHNHTWDVVPRPPNTTIIGSKWVYTTKFNPDGTLARYKARLVAQGFRQEYGIDYDETFAPVAKMQTVRTLLALASQKHWPLLQLDVKNAFFHGDLKEIVYMACPPGYPAPPNSVCLLRRSLYGLKQAPRAWFEKFHHTILASGFRQSDNDPSLFIKSSSRGITILLIYVDDIILTGSDDQGITTVRHTLGEHFYMKELGPLSYFLGLEITRHKDGVFLGQQKYISDLLEEARHADCKPCSTPIEQNVKYSKEEGALLDDPHHYRKLVGSLIYLTNTRPDLAYAVQIVSQFMASPRQPHLAAVYRILRYLQGTRHMGLFFPSSASHDLIAFADADYAGCMDTRRSTSGWCIQLGHSFISWRCKKQDRVSKSSTEAEYRSMSEVCSEIVWLTRLLAELGHPILLPVQLHGDNTSAIQIATNPVLHDRTKHIETHVHYIRELVASGDVRLLYIRSDDQVADLFTKAVSTSRHWFLTHKLMMIDHQFEGGC